MSFTGLVVVCAIAFVAPLVSNAIPRVRIPAIVLEILAGVREILPGTPTGHRTD